MIRLIRRSLAGAAIAASVFAFACAAGAQEARSMITQPIDPTHLARLSGNTHPLALAKYDHGAAPSSLAMNHLLLVLQRSSEQETALDTFLAEQQEKSSPNYHKWLTPKQYGEQYGPSESDVQKIASWLQSQGLTVNSVSNGRTMIDFSGTAGTIQSAFHTSIHKYIYANGEQHWANASDPEIPAALAQAVVGVNRLNDFRPKRMSHNAGVFHKELNSSKAHRANPQFTEAGAGCYGNGTDCYAVGPYDFAKIYNVTPLWNAGTTGTGQTIAIVSDSDVVTSDYTQFRSIFGLPALTLNRVLPTKVNPGVQNCNANTDELEAILDVEWAGAVAPGAQIDLVISPTAGANCTGVAGEAGFDFGGDYSAQYVVDNNTAPILSDSYGECEYGLGTAENAFYNKLWQQAAGEGITVSVASGDSGSPGCDSYDVNYSDPDVVEPAGLGLAVNGTASTPYNVAVGGTDFYYANFNNPSQYWSSSNTASGTTSTQSALGYIPEMVWNDSCTNFAIYQGLVGDLPNLSNALSACNNAEIQNDDLVGPVGGSGGASNCISALSNNANQPTGCSGGYQKPKWQTGAGVPSDGVRDIPDVSLFGSDGYISGSFYAECEADLEQEEVGVSGQPCSTTVQNGANGSYVVVEGVGGTSASAQVFAGAMALMVQVGGRQGNVNPTLYALANSQSASSCASASPASSCFFHDVTAGSNSMPCVQSSLNCTGATNSNPVGVMSGFAAGSGFDLATGLGTPNIANLVAAVGTPTFSLSSGATSVTIPAGSSTGTVTIDASAIGTFTGDVTSFSCTGLPTGATCAAGGSINLTGVGTTGSTTLTITLASAAAHVQPFSAPASSHSSGTSQSRTNATLFGETTISLIGFTALLALYAKSRKRIAMSAFAVVVLGMIVITSACGGGGGSSSGGGGGGGGGTTGTSYTVTVTGASSNGTPSATATFTLVVD